MKNDIQPTNPFATIISVLGIFALSLVTAVSQVTPGGTVGDTAIYLEVEGGEQLTRATAAGAYGPTLVHDFDTEQLADATYQLNPSGANATEIAVSAGRHLMLYNTRFIATAGTNRAEIQTWITLGGSEMAAGRSQGYIRRTGNVHPLHESVSLHHHHGRCMSLLLPFRSCVARYHYCGDGSELSDSEE